MAPSTLSWLGDEFNAVCSCCQRPPPSPKDDTRVKWFGLLDPNGYTVDIPASFCLRTSWWVLLVKFVMWGFSLASLIYGWYDDPYHAYWFLAYLTHWTMFYAVIYLTFSFGTSLFVTYGNFHWAVNTTWVLYTVAAVHGLVVVIMFWASEYSKEDYEMDYFLIVPHGISFALVWFDGLVVNRVPVRLVHYLVSLVLGILFVVWSLFQGLLPVDNPKAEENNADVSLYTTLDWANEPQFAAGISVLNLFVLMPMFTLFFWGLSLLFGRRYIEKEDDEGRGEGDANEDEEQKGDSTDNKKQTNKGGDASEEEEEEETDDVENPSTEMRNRSPMDDHQQQQPKQQDDEIKNNDEKA